MLPNLSWQYSAVYLLSWRHKFVGYCCAVPDCEGSYTTDFETSVTGVMTKDHQMGRDPQYPGQEGVPPASDYSQPPQYPGGQPSVYPGSDPYGDYQGGQPQFGGLQGGQTQFGGFSNHGAGMRGFMQSQMQPGMTGFEDKSVRRAFIRKVYAILMVQLILTAGIMAVFMFVSEVKM